MMVVVGDNDGGMAKKKVVIVNGDGSDKIGLKS